MAFYLFDIEQSLHAPHNLLVLGGLILVSLAIYSAILIPIYNITLHPLAKIPGPRLYTAYHFPYYIDRWAGAVPQKSLKYHNLYGSAVRLRPDLVSFNTAQGWQDIYGFRHGKGQLQKDAAAIGRRTGDVDIIMSNDTDHARFRKLLAHAFSDKALHEQEHLIMSYVDLLMDKLGQKLAEPAMGVIDIKSWFNYTTFDVIGDLAFGRAFGGLENENVHYYVETLFQAIKDSRRVHIALAYPFLAKVFSLFGSTANGARYETLQYSKITVDKRLDDGKIDRKDFVSYILRYNDDKGMSREEIIKNAAVLLIAGSETTATLLSGAVYYLLCNPTILKKLNVELRTTYKTEQEITLSSVAHLEYLHAVLEETLRLYPPVPTGILRITGHDEIIDGREIPRNTRVTVTQLAAYHSASNFTNPLCYVPERWLNPPPPEYVNDNRDALQPFSTGPRNCIGKNLAYAEMRVILARLLWTFDLELEESSKGWAERQIAFAVWEKPELIVKLSKRN